MATRWTPERMAKFARVWNELESVDAVAEYFGIPPIYCQRLAYRARLSGLRLTDVSTRRKAVA